MAKQLQLRKGTDTEHNTFTGADGEVTVDTTNKTLRVHDGSTVGGIRLATFTMDRGFGVEQNWQNVTASRSKNVTYTNNTGKAILVNVCAVSDDLDGGLMVIVEGVLVGYSGNINSLITTNTITFIVPNMATYVASGNARVDIWAELR